MQAFSEVVSTLYIALAEAAGGAAALEAANSVIRVAIRDRAIDDPVAIELLSALVDADRLPIASEI